MTSLDNFPEGLLLGEPIIGLLEQKDMFEDGKRGLSETKFYTTNVHLEVQFLKEVPLNFEDVLLENILVDDWVSDILWVNETCFDPPNPDCYVERKYESTTINKYLTGQEGGPFLVIFCSILNILMRLDWAPI